MRRILYFALGVAAFVAAPLTHSATDPTSGPIARYATAGDFETVKEDVTLAIEGKGLVIDHVSHIQDMLDRTGKDLGTPRPVYRAGEAFSFCSAVVSRRMMEANVHHIAFCPYTIAVYVVPQEPGRVYVAYRRPPVTGDKESRAALKAVEKLLDSIVREALGLKN